MRDLTMENPIRAIREISHDVTGQRKVRLANGREASALEIQSEYLAKARDFVDRRQISTPVIEQALDPLPDAVPPRADDHAAADARFLGQIALGDDGLIPGGEIRVAGDGQSVLHTRPIAAKTHARQEGGGSGLSPPRRKG